MKNKTIENSNPIGKIFQYTVKGRYLICKVISQGSREGFYWTTTLQSSFFSISPGERCEWDLSTFTPLGNYNEKQDD